MVSNVKLGLIIPAVLINPLCPPKKCNLKKGGPPGLINPPIKKPPVLKSIFYPTIFISNSMYFQFVFTFFLNHHCYT